MGQTKSKVVNVDETSKVAYMIRKRNIKAVRKIQKIIEKGYYEGYLQELEFLSTVGWYGSLKNRMTVTGDPIFAAALDELCNNLYNSIQDRVHAQARNSKKKEYDEAQIPAIEEAENEDEDDLGPLGFDPYKFMVRDSPYQSLSIEMKKVKK